MRKYVVLSFFALLAIFSDAQGFVDPGKAKTDSCQTGRPCTRCDSLLSQCRTAKDSVKVYRLVHERGLRNSTERSPLVLYGSRSKNVKDSAETGDFQGIAGKTASQEARRAHNGKAVR